MGANDILIWRLRGDTLRNIVCVRRSTASGLVALQVLLDQDTLLDEMYPDDRTATSRATAIRNDLLRRGWLLDTAA